MEKAMVGTEVEMLTQGEIWLEGEKVNSTDLLVDKYKEGGLQFLIENLDGNYSVLIIDKANNFLHLITDRFATRPTYIYWDKNKGLFSCANSIQAISKDLGLKKVNWEQAIYKNRTASEQHFEPTFVAGVKRMNGGVLCSVDFKKSQLNTVNYLSKVEDKPLINLPSSVTGIVDAYGFEIEKSIDKYLIGNDKALITLSGGLDSSIIYALVADKVEVSAVSICTVTSLHNFEIDRARELTKKYGSNHLILPIGLDDKPLKEDWIKLVLSTEKIENDFESFVKSQLFTKTQDNFNEYELLLSGMGSDQFNGGTTVFDYAGTGFNDSLAKFMNNMFSNKWSKYQKNNFTNFFQFAYNFTALEFRENLWPFEADEWSKYIEDNSYSLQRNGVLLETKLAQANQFSIGLPFLDRATLRLLESIPENYHDDLFYNKQILRSAFKDLLPKSFEGKPKFHKTKNAGEKIFKYLKNLVYEDNYALLKLAYDASPELQSKFSIDKLISFLGEARTSNYFPAFSHVLSIINIGLLDAHLLHGEDFSFEKSNSNYRIYASTEKGFDRALLEKQILTTEVEEFDVPVTKMEELTIYESQNGAEALYLIEFNDFEHIRIKNSDTLKILSAINGNDTINEICKETTVSLESVENELQLLLEKKIIF